MEGKRLKSQTLVAEEEPETTVATKPDVETMVLRGAQTVRTVLRQAGSSVLKKVQGAQNEVQYLMNVTAIAVKSGSYISDPAEEKLNRARLRGMERIMELRKAAEPVLETGEVCDLLGVSRETIRKKVDTRKLLALPKGNDRVFPGFQFHEGAVLPGFSEALNALDTDSPFTALAFFLSKNADFDGKSALEMLQTGETEPVLSEARTFLKHGG
jgi:hypothetical protein